MPSGVYLRTTQARINIGKAALGRTPWNKGRTGIYSEETRRLIGSYTKGKRNPQLSEANRNRVYTPELRKKMSERQKGEKGSNWRGGIGVINVKIRNSIEGKLWREAVFRRDDWTCQKCNDRGGLLRAHHKNSFNKFNNMRFDIHNGVTLCEKCHREFHKKFGLRLNTKKQYNRWLR